MADYYNLYFLERAMTMFKRIISIYDKTLLITILKFSICIPLAFLIFFSDIINNFFYEMLFPQNQPSVPCGSFYAAFSLIALFTSCGCLISFITKKSTYFIALAVMITQIFLIYSPGGYFKFIFASAVDFISLTILLLFCLFIDNKHNVIHERKVNNTSIKLFVIKIALLIVSLIVTFVVLFNLISLDPLSLNGFLMLSLYNPGFILGNALILFTPYLRKHVFLILLPAAIILFFSTHIIYLPDFYFDVELFVLWFLFLPAMLLNYLFIKIIEDKWFNVDVP